MEDDTKDLFKDVANPIPKKTKSRHLRVVKKDAETTKNPPKDEEEMDGEEEEELGLLDILSDEFIAEEFRRCNFFGGKK